LSAMYILHDFFPDQAYLIFRTWCQEGTAGCLTTHLIGQRQQVVIEKDRSSGDYIILRTTTVSLTGATWAGSRIP
jgi:hypothetical protein